MDRDQPPAAGGRGPGQARSTTRPGRGGRHLGRDQHRAQAGINAPIFGGPLRLSILASNPDDRLLDILAVEDIPPARMLLSGLAMLLRSPKKVPGIRIWHTARIHAHSDQPLDVTLDGELLGTLPGDFEVVGEALHVITPVTFIDL